jgi:glycosyltransferase involved in cell wall biosynthesis
MKGSYASFEALPLERFGAFLYTSHFDGLPNVLLSAGAAGLPIVAPAVGGIAELVNGETGWLIGRPEDTAAYVEALRHIRSDPAEAARRTAAMRGLLDERHSWRSYLAAMTAEPSFLTGGRGEAPWT